MDLTHPHQSIASVSSPNLPLLCGYLERQQALYAILDAARDRRVREFLHTSQLPFLSLFEGLHAETLAEFAPYLTKLPSAHPFLEALVNHAWGNSWGVYCVSQHPAEAILAHLKKQIWAHTPNGRMLFRFYDPRVLREFLPVFNAKTAWEFFGPVDAFLMENEKGTALLRFTLGNEGAKLEAIALDCTEYPQPPPTSASFGESNEDDGNWHERPVTPIP